MRHDQHLTQPQVLSMLYRTQAQHNMGVPDCNLGSTPKLGTWGSEKGPHRMRYSF